MTQPYKDEPRDLEYHDFDYRQFDAELRGYAEAMNWRRTQAATAAKFA